MGLLLLISIIEQGNCQVKYTHGVELDLESYNRIPKKVALIRGDYEKLADSISLKTYCPKPGNQIQLNTSTSWAVSYAARTILDAESKNITDRNQITRNSFSPVFNYAVSTNFRNKACTLPTTLSGVLESLKNIGVPKYFDFQQFCPNSISQKIYENASSFRITDFTGVGNQ